MNYHLMIDDKFIDGFIEDAEKAAPNENIYIYTFKPPKTHITSNKGIFADYGSEDLELITKKINHNDKVFIHWLSDSAAHFILKLDTNIKVGIFYWAGDLISDPFSFYKERLLQKKTLKLYNKTNNPSFIEILRSPASYYNNKKESRKKDQIRLDLKKAAVNRINFFCHWSIIDYEMVKSIYSCKKLIYKYYYYNINLDNIQALNNPFIIKKKDVTVFIGNSATYPNNHIETLDLLKKYTTIRIYAPLSYGEHAYKEYIISYGRKLFGDRFIPITNFLTKQEYYTLLDKSDIVIMNHIRSQAVGNLWAYLKLGKKIYLNKKSTVYELFNNKNIKIYTTTDLLDKEHDLLAPLSPRDVQNNYTVFNNLFNYNNKIISLKNLLCN